MPTLLSQTLNYRKTVDVDENIKTRKKEGLIQSGFKYYYKAINIRFNSV